MASPSSPSSPKRKQLTKPVKTEKRRQIEKQKHILGVCLVGRSVSSGSYQEVYSGSVVRGLLQFKGVQNKVFLLVSDNALSKKDLENLCKSKSCDSIAEKYTLFFIDRKDSSKLKTYDLHEITSEEEEVMLDLGLVIIPIDRDARKLNKKSGILDYRPFPVNKEKASLENSLCQIVQGNTSCFSVRTLVLEHKGENYSLKLSEQESFKTLTDLQAFTKDLHPGGAVILREGEAVGVLNFVDDKIVPRDFATSQVFGCAGSIKNQVVDGDGNSTADSKQAEEHVAESVNISSNETHQPTAKHEMTPNESSSNKGKSPSEDVNVIGGKGKGSKEQTTGDQKSLRVTIDKSLNELASFNATTSKDSSQASGIQVDHNTGDEQCGELCPPSPLAKTQYTSTTGPHHSSRCNLESVPQDFQEDLLRRKLSAIRLKFYRQICIRLDKVRECFWDDYRLLGEKIGLTKYEVAWLGQNSNPTHSMMQKFDSKKDSNIGKFMSILEEMERHDVVSVISEWIVSEWNAACSSS